MTIAPADSAGLHSGEPDPSGEDGEAQGPRAWVTARPARFADFIQRVLGLPKLMLKHRDLISSTVRRELEARFKGTVMGWFWPLLHPLFLFVVYYFIFTKLLQFKIATNIPPGQESALGIYMFVGILAFAAFSDSVTRAATSIVDNGNLIKKLAFPSEILPLNVTLVGLITLMFGLTVFILGSIFTPIWTPPGWSLLWLPLCLLLQGIFTYGLALILATLQVFLRDTVQVVGVLLTAWMFGTPLFWVPELIQGPSIEHWMPLIKANPMYHCIYAWRGTLMGDLITYKDTAMTVVDSHVVHADQIGQHLLAFTPWAIGAYVLGYALFVFSQRRFADEV